MALFNLLACATNAAPKAEHGSTKVGEQVVVVPELLVMQARKVLREAHGAYLQGDYYRAEAGVSQAVGLYPFLTEGHMLFGRILLLKGVATSNVKVMIRARRMFEMAYTLDSGLSEAEQLMTLLDEKLTIQ